MVKYNKLVRDNVAGLLKDKGYLISGKKLKGDKYNFELYSLFWLDFKSSLSADSRQVYGHYADMLEVIRTLMVTNNVNIRKLKSGESQPISWYKSFASPDKKLASARTDLLQKFNELLQMKTEAIKDQLNDIFNSFKSLLIAHNIDFAHIEEIRRGQFEKLGGFTKGIYLEEVTKKVTQQHKI